MEIGRTKWGGKAYQDTLTLTHTVLKWRDNKSGGQEGHTRAGYITLYQIRTVSGLRRDKNEHQIKLYGGRHGGYL